MPTQPVPQPSPTIAAILGRALGRTPDAVTADGARFILALRIHQEDQQRTLQLLERRSEGLITPEEDQELLSYIEADRILTVLKAQARLALKEAGAAP